MAAFERERRTDAGRASAGSRSRRWASRLDSWSSRASCRWRAIRRSASRDWDEFHDHADEAMLREQGARCMDCGVPFCHTGDADRRHGRRAARSTTSSPSGTTSSTAACGARPSTGCTRPTTSPSSPAASAPRRAKARACSASTSRPVTIKSIECAIIDKGFEEGWVVPEPPADAHRQEGRGGRLRPGGPGLRRPAQQGRPLGHRLRARRPHRRPADVRHPQHEARQEASSSAASI